MINFVFNAQRESISLRGANLTPRRSDVAVRIMQGKTVRDIAAARNLTVKTVSSHLNGIYRMTGLSSRFELAAAMAKEHASLIHLSEGRTLEAYASLFDVGTHCRVFGNMGLTPAEIEIFDLLKLALKEVYIAECLDKSTSTVNKQIDSIYRKFNLTRNDIIVLYNLLEAQKQRADGKPPPDEHIILNTPRND